MMGLGNGKKKVPEKEMPRPLFGQNGLMAEIDRPQNYKPPAKPRLDQIADVLQQLTYTEMMDFDAQLGELYSKMQDNDVKQYAVGSFAALMKLWMEANQANQVQTQLDIELSPEPAGAY